MILPVREKERQCAEVFDDFLARTRAGKALQEFLQNQAGSDDGMAALDLRVGVEVTLAGLGQDSVAPALAALARIGVKEGGKLPLSVRVDPSAKLAAEGYVLDVKPAGITVTAADATAKKKGGARQAPLPENVEKLEQAVIGRRIVSAERGQVKGYGTQDALILTLDDGTLTVGLATICALRMRVSRSEMGSLMLMSKLSCLTSWPW